MEKFALADFSPERYVRELARSCVGGEELQQQKYKIEALGVDTAKALKRNVYENHMQFIETATEISHLESEMYKLSHLLSEQRSVLTTLSHTSILGHEKSLSQESLDERDVEAEKAQELEKNKLNAISEKVENCLNLFDVPDRHLLHEGDLLEIDPDENSALQRMHVYLFNDCLMLTSWISNRRGPMRYKFQNSYPINSLAVVNVRDLGSVKQAFKVLAFPDTRVFQCNSLAIKKDWLDKFDSAKKMYIEKENVEQKKKENKAHPKLDLGSPSISVEEVTTPQEAPLPEWISNIAEELDVLLVERHFQKAFELILHGHKTLNSVEYKNHTDRHKILDNIELKQKDLIEILIKELSVTNTWSPRGGLLSNRQCITILNSLNMTSQACDLFLTNCSHTVKVHVKSIQLEGSTNSFVQQVGETFFCTLSDALTEFIYLFPKNKISAFVVWANMQLKILMAQIIKQIFTPTCTLDSILECVQCLREQCKLFCEYGLDLRFQLNSCLRSPITKALKEYKDRCLDSMKTKISEDSWTPVNLHTRTGMTRFLNRMQMLGLVLVKFIVNETWIDLSSSTIWFAQSVLTLQKVGMSLATRDMCDVLEDCVYEVFRSRLALGEGGDSDFTKRNFNFILDTVIPLALRCYREEVGNDNEKLMMLGKKYGVSIAPWKKSNITKYTTTEYL